MKEMGNMERNVEMWEGNYVCVDYINQQDVIMCINCGCYVTCCYLGGGRLFGENLLSAQKCT